MLRARRGVRELDVLLARFIEEHLDGLTAPALQSLERLLEGDDQDLLDWVLGRARPADAPLAALVEDIRSGSLQGPRQPQPRGVGVQPGAGPADPSRRD